VTVADESGWEFETIKRVYANFGIDSKGQTSGTAWQIVSRSPDSTALRQEEIRVEKLTFAVEPRDGKRFTIQAKMLYHYAPVVEGPFGREATATKMTEATVYLPGKRPS
jgi:hypothetical protein